MDIERILIVCIGNVCRSPMAAALMRKMLEEERTTHARVESAGIEALVGYPPAGHAQALLQEEGLDVSTHRARQLSPRMLSEANLDIMF